MARPKGYETKVQPYIDKIREWVAAGATNDEIAKALGVHVSTLIKYKKEYNELNDAFARGHANVIIDIKAALLKKALGFHYEEKVQAIKPDKDGNEQVYTEIRTRYCVPSETAAAMLLRNLDPDYHDGDNVTVRLKEQEATLRKKIAESRDIIE